MTSIKIGNHPQRLEVLDLARGAGFLIVLLTHCLSFIGPAVTRRFVPQDATILDFFFLMSGFFAGYAYEGKLCDSRKTISQAIAERAIRIFPLVALGTGLGLISLLIWSPGKDDAIPLLTLMLKGFALIPANGAQLGSADLFPLDIPLWFLLYDWLGFLLFLFVFRHLSLKWLVATAAVAAFGLWRAALSRNTLSFGAHWDDCFWSIPRSLAGFTSGYILFRLYKPGRLVIGPRFGLLPVLALLVVVLLPVPADWRYSGALQAGIAMLIMPLIVFFGAQVHAGSITARLAGMARKIALPVYALHYPVVRTLSLLRWDLNLHGASGLVLLSLEFLFPIALAFLVATYLDTAIRGYTAANVRAHLFRKKTEAIPLPPSA